MDRRIGLAACLAALLALTGCSGGSVAIRSGFPPPPSAGGAHAGLSVKGGNGLALAILLAVALADGMYWTARQLNGDNGDEREPQARRPLFQPIDRGWVDRGP